MKVTTVSIDFYHERNYVKQILLYAEIICYKI